jgi:hypothetical protein
VTPNVTTWSPDDLDRVGDATELQLASKRDDGTRRPYVTIWGVRTGDNVYVRSAYGPDNGWFRRARSSGSGWIRAGGVECEVTFAAPDPAVQEDVDAAYRTKYGRYSGIVEGIVGPKVYDVTLRVDPVAQVRTPDVGRRTGRTA